MTHGKISQLLWLTISVSARKLVSLAWGFVNSLLYDLMQTHFMSVVQYGKGSIDCAHCELCE